MKRIRRFRPGVTLAETMVVLGAFAVLSTGLLSLFGTAMDQWNRGSGKSEADDVASLALQSVVRSIEDGKSATVGMSGLTIQLPGKNDQGDYERSLNGDTVLLYVSSGTLYRRVNSGTARAVARGVTSFSSSVVGGNVTLTLTVSRQSGTRTSQTSLTQRVALRNYASAS